MHSREGRLIPRPGTWRISAKCVPGAELCIRLGLYVSDPPVPCGPSRIMCNRERSDVGRFNSTIVVRRVML